MKIQLSPKQRETVKWFASDYRWLFLSGTVRSGKSFGLDLGWLLWTQGKWNDPTDFIIGGHSVSAIRRNILPEMEKFARALGIGWQLIHTGPYVQCGPHRFHLFGSRDADAAEAVRGMTAGGAYFDEMTLMHEDFIAMCITRCSLKNSKLIGSTNPSYPMHFIKTDYIDRVEELKGVHQEYGFPDNPVLDPQYIEDLERTLTGADYERMFLGKWVANAGLIYPVYHKCNGELERGRSWKRNVVAIDYSTSGITSFLLCRFDRNNQTVVTDEFFHDGGGEGSSKQLTDRDLVVELAQFATRNKLRQAEVQVLPDPSAASFKRELRKQGWRVRSANNDILDGIRVTGVALKGGHILISNKCVKLQKELGTYLWDEKKTEKGEDQPEKTRVHHGVDALRYYAMKTYRRLLRIGPIAKPEGL